MGGVRASRPRTFGCGSSRLAGGLQVAIHPPQGALHAVRHFAVEGAGPPVLRDKSRLVTLSSNSRTTWRPNPDAFVEEVEAILRNLGLEPGDHEIYARTPRWLLIPEKTPNASPDAPSLSRSSMKSPFPLFHFQPFYIGGRVVVEFFTMDEGTGKTAHVASIAQEVMLQCPHLIVEASHYRANGTCKCDEPAEQRRMIREWGYTKADFPKPKRKSTPST